MFLSAITQEELLLVSGPLLVDGRPSLLLWTAVGLLVSVPVALEQKKGILRPQLQALVLTQGTTLWSWFL